MPMRDLADRRRYAPHIRWTGHAAACLPADLCLVEEGHPGRTTCHDDPVEGAHKNGLRALPILLETHRPIDAVVLMLGTNDFKTRFDARAQDVAQAVETLLGVIAAAAAGPAGGCPKILIVAPPPVAEIGCLAEVFQGGAARARGLGAALADVARRHGTGFVDAGDLVTVSPVDGVHFEPEAHATLGRAIGRALARLMDWPLP